MKITSLELKAFRSWVDTTFPMGVPRVFVAGLNNSGKSSLREAVKWVFSGRCQGLDGKGSGVDCLIPDWTRGDATKSSEKLRGAAAALTIDGIGTVARESNPSTLVVQGFTGDKTAQQAGLLMKLNTSEAFLQAVLDTEVFLRLHHADAKALVLNLLNVRVPVGSDTTLTLDELDAVYKRAFEDRKTAKIKVKAHVVPPLPGGEVLNLDAINTQLGKLEDALAKALTATGGVSAKRQACQAALDRLGRMPIEQPLSGDAIATLQNSIRDAEDQLAAMEAEVAPDPEPEPLTQPTKNLDVASRADLESRIQTLSAFQPTKGCIIDGSVPCQTHKLKFTKRAKALQDLVDTPSGGDETPAPKPSGSPLTAVRKGLDELRARMEAHRRAAEARDTRQAERETLEAELASLPDVSEQEAQIAELQRRIGVGQGKRREAEVSRRATAAHEVATAALQTLQGEVNRLEALCEVLGPSGARVEALAQALGPFVAAINTYTGIFGWQVTFHVEPWGVEVNGRPVETYSKSEQYRIGLAIQLALAALSGLSFAIVDEFDMLDEINRAIVARMLMAAPVEQIIFLSTREANKPLPAMSGMLAYRVGMQDGRSVILERTGA